ncbi:MAG: methyltransferase domain-containing protein [Chlamydiae bacterium]|nr:methyltransferase domain-containing protein [Chlamydiota bacterium]
MSISPSSIVAQRTLCAVCGQTQLDRIMDLPGLPLTGLFSSRAMGTPAETFDQALLVCVSCGHGELEYQIDPEKLYDSSYSFRTSQSDTARCGTHFFLSFLDQVASGRRFECVLDLGCNDLHLLNSLGNRASYKIGVDPIWVGRESEIKDSKLQVFGSTIEELSSDDFSKKPDLVLCRHTLEHIYDPVSVVRRLLDIVQEGALLVFEVPGFDALIRKFRFDQVFHQHLQYFSLKSFCSLLEKSGGKYLAHSENYHDWGAMIVAFQKQGYPRTSLESPNHSFFSTDEIHKRYRLFKTRMALIKDELFLYHQDPMYGYGAAQMLPILAYHLRSDLSFLKCILDDDPEKEGLYYQNLPLEIRSSQGVKDWSEVTVLLTAVDSAKGILTKLLTEKRPKHLLYPLTVI